MCPAAMRSLVLLSFVVFASAFRLPFKLIQPAPVTNVTSGGQYIALYDKAYYVVNVTVGTPPQLFTVIADTGSGDLSIADFSCNVPSGVCATADCKGVPPPVKDGSTSTCYGKRQFDKTASSTYVANPISFISTDKYGTTAGYTGTDVVNLGEFPASAITIPNASIDQVNTVPAALQNYSDIDGVLGLGFAGLSYSGNTPVFLQAIQQGDVADSIITLWLEHQNQPGDDGMTGDLFYGGYDLRHCNPSPIMASLTRATDYFQFTMNNFVFNTYTFNQRAQAILDTSLAVIRAPPQVVTQVYNTLGLTVNGQMQPTIDCSTKISLQFKITGNANEIVTVTEGDLIYPNDDSTCRLAFVQAPDMNGDKGVRFDLGIPFIRGRCTLFDYVRHQIGFGSSVMDNPA